MVTIFFYDNDYYDMVTIFYDNDYDDMVTIFYDNDAGAKGRVSWPSGLGSLDHLKRGWTRKVDQKTYISAQLFVILQNS